jgi:hypothetical protein
LGFLPAGLAGAVEGTAGAASIAMGHRRRERRRREKNPAALDK